MATPLTHKQIEEQKAKAEAASVLPKIANTSGIHPEEEFTTTCVSASHEQSIKSYKTEERDPLAEAAGLIQENGEIRGLIAAATESDEEFLRFLTNTFYSAPKGSNFRRMALLAINALAARSILAEEA